MPNGEIDENNLFVRMHNAGLVRENKAKSVEELAEFLALNKDSIVPLIELGRRHGYLEAIEDGRLKYFLSKKGIMFVSSLFT